jgi:hypothetical protein
MRAWLVATLIAPPTSPARPCDRQGRRLRRDCRHVPGHPVRSRRRGAAGLCGPPRAIRGAAHRGHRSRCRVGGAGPTVRCRHRRRRRRGRRPRRCRRRRFERLAARARAAGQRFVEHGACIDPAPDQPRAPAAPGASHALRRRGRRAMQRHRSGAPHDRRRRRAPGVAWRAGGRARATDLLGTPDRQPSAPLTASCARYQRPGAHTEIHPCDGAGPVASP